MFAPLFLKGSSTKSKMKCRHYIFHYLERNGAIGFRFHTSHLTLFDDIVLGRSHCGVESSFVSGH